MSAEPVPVALAPEAVEAIARRVAELMAEQSRPAPGRWVDAAELAQILGVERSTIYAHSARFGARRMTAGSRARLRFDLAEALAAWELRTTGRPRATAPRAPRRRTGADGRLLPIRGQEGL